MLANQSVQRHHRVLMVVAVAQPVAAAQAALVHRLENPLVTRLPMRRCPGHSRLEPDTQPLPALRDRSAQVVRDTPDTTGP